MPSPRTGAGAAGFVPQRGLAESPPCSSAFPGAYGCLQTPPVASPHGSDRWRAHTLAPMHAVDIQVVLR